MITIDANLLKTVEVPDHIDPENALYDPDSKRWIDCRECFAKKNRWPSFHSELGLIYIISEETEINNLEIYYDKIGDLSRANESQLDELQRLFFRVKAKASGYYATKDDKMIFYPGLPK